MDENQTRKIKKLFELFQFLMTMCFWGGIIIGCEETRENLPDNVLLEDNLSIENELNLSGAIEKEVDSKKIISEFERNNDDAQVRNYDIATGNQKIKAVITYYNIKTKNRASLAIVLEDNIAFFSIAPDESGLEITNNGEVLLLENDEFFFAVYDSKTNEVHNYQVTYNILEDGTNNFEFHSPPKTPQL